ncbi:unnamed protein product, partial [Rotaria magnacalcarata]
TKEALDLVKKTSEQIPKSFYSNPRLLTSLLDALMKCGDVARAESLFHSSKQKILPMYGAMMKGINHLNIYDKVELVVPTIHFVLSIFALSDMVIVLPQYDFMKRIPK